MSRLCVNLCTWSVEPTCNLRSHIDAGAFSNVCNGFIDLSYNNLRLDRDLVWVRGRLGPWTHLTLALAPRGWQGRHLHVSHGGLLTCLWVGPHLWSQDPYLFLLEVQVAAAVVSCSTCTRTKLVLRRCRRSPTNYHRYGCLEIRRFPSTDYLAAMGANVRA